MNTSYLSNSYRPLDILLEFAATPKNGMFQITGEGVTWCLDFLHGRLRYCNHSLQTFETIEIHLQALGYEMAIAPSQRIIRQQRYLPDRGLSVDHLAWTHRLVQQLSMQGILSWNQANILISQLSKDSLEPLIWLQTGQITPLDDTASIYDTYDPRWQGNSFSTLMEMLLQRLHVWRGLAPHIQSPHQCPWFTDISRIYESVPNGIIPIAKLLALKQVMNGVSLRQLSQRLNQDELKLAQLLSPYVQQGIVQFTAPAPPLDRLPTVPSASSVSPTLNRSPQLDAGPSAPKQNEAVSFPGSSSQSSVSNRVSPGRSSTHRREGVTTPGSTASGSTASDLSTRGGGGLAEPSSQMSAEQSNADNVKPYKIVCIDDSPTMLETLKYYLDNDCFEVTTLENPMQSASTVFSSRPDLILMDVAMPGIKGDRLCKILRRSSAFKTTPIIMVTGLTKEIGKAEAIAMGANDYLAKPFSQETLLKLMDRYLNFSQPVASAN